MNQRYLQHYLKFCSLVGTFPLGRQGGSWFYSKLNTVSTLCHSVFHAASSLILMKQSVFVDESELIARLIYAYLEPPLLPVLFLFVWLLKETMLKNYLALDKHVFSEGKSAEFYPKSILLHFGGIVLTSILLVFNQINRNYLNVLVDYKFLILVVQLLSISMQVSWVLRIGTKSLETIYDNLALVEDPSYADIRRTIKTHEFTTDVLESFVEGYGPLILITTPLCLMEITAICSVVIYNIQHGYILKVLIDLCWLTLLALTVGEMINACMEASQQAEKFNKLLAACALKDESEKIVLNPYIYMHFATKKTLTFTACKCFNIDYRLGCSMVAACVTYLVILLQFDGPKNPRTTGLPPNITDSFKN
ncbi:Hypothetical protein NTJ_09203 [Nesidiocoris tenuis]|uniref:Gustatory receptor n=1 Tax=Nesidiocoris tenuis TaxID=355587 RepID=A0ABN7AYD7_9HEMI|nr:Hypothetical protein NTJ_09203 [Nesidiocoris tenuis]